VNLNIVMDEYFSQPIDVVWRALTERSAIAFWLMENNFEPRVGAMFTMKCPPGPGVRGWVDAQVIAIDPPRRMEWSWSVSDDEPPTTVVFELAEMPSGTRLILKHTGETDPFAATRFTNGWTAKMTALGAFLSGLATTEVPHDQ
jgi:uncharacterized protein YndB with AHSA1/START domain